MDSGSCAQLLHGTFLIRRTSNRKPPCYWNYANLRNYALKMDSHSLPTRRIPTSFSRSFLENNKSKLRKNKSKEHSKNLSGSNHKDFRALTIAGCNKVVYNGFITIAIWIMISWSVFVDGTNRWNQETYFFSRNRNCNEKRYLANMASDLEAFSR